MALPAAIMILSEPPGWLATNSVSGRHLRRRQPRASKHTDAARSCSSYPFKARDTSGNVSYNSERLPTHTAG
jgi:hypothetical protein